jgi:hypothetical protein
MNSRMVKAEELMVQHHRKMAKVEEDMAHLHDKILTLKEVGLLEQQ